MVEIKSLTQLAISDFHRLVVGYTSDARYRAKKVDTPEKLDPILRSPNFIPEPILTAGLK